MGSEASAVAESGLEILSEEEWLSRVTEHERVIGTYIDAYRSRRSSRQKHPVHDFLFEYYQTNRTVLRKWRPSVRQCLQGAAAERFLEDERYHETEYGVCLDTARIDEKATARLQWAKQLLEAAKGRLPRFNCFGLHEWAMVYKAEEIRHESTPLRLSPEEVAEVVESNSLRCSHFDAFRFFTDAARPLNELQPGRDQREQNEQFGCVHFNMDLYRWSFKSSPWVGSDLIRDCFQLALEARELDMRASPYDLSEYGYEPIQIETPAGKETYAAEQMRIYRQGQVLADRLIGELARVVGE